MSKLLGKAEYFLPATTVAAEVTCYFSYLKRILFYIVPNSDVTRAKDDSDRLNKLIIAEKTFNHNETDKHDNDIKAGAVKIVCGILRSCSPFQKTQTRSCLAILLQLYRCSPSRLCASFCTDAAALTPQLMELIEINYRLVFLAFALVRILFRCRCSNI